ncbi:hypothetical protein GCM10022212_01740 [Actimicrobium antarcticum]|uniref:Uncharacterized protein n=1 Tax=Actimicrobium antarcticum TaxID=1051899 RepID=A0ABP7SIH5_9BURK
MSVSSCFYTTDGAGACQFNSLFFALTKEIFDQMKRMHNLYPDTRFGMFLFVENGAQRSLFVDILDRLAADFNLELE